MKRLLLYTIIFSFIGTGAFAQQDKEAKTILSALSKKYRSYTSIKTDFEFTLENKQAGYNQTQTGMLITKPKSNQFKISLYSPVGKSKAAMQQEIMSDGKTQWTYLVADKEVQVNDAGQADEAFNPAQIFTIYEKGYKYLYTGTQKLGGRLYQVIDLTPEAENAQFFKIRLMIDKVKKEIYKVTVFDRSGSRYNYTLKATTPNVPVANDYFSFDPKKHPGVEVVDLR